MMKAEGFAVATGDVIDVRTVSPHERGAKVNWLYTAMNVQVLDNWSDEIIEKVWDHYTKDTDVQCIAVVVAAKEADVAELGNLEANADASTAEPFATVNKPV